MRLFGRSNLERTERISKNMKFNEYFYIFESLNDPYRWRGNIETEQVEDEDYYDEDNEQPIYKDVMSPVQMFRFKTDDDIPYLLYFRQDRYSDVFWEVAFGVEKGKGVRGESLLDIGKTRTGNAFRIFSTVLEIINRVIEQDENYEIQYIKISSEGDNRTRLYRNHIIPRIEKFEEDEVKKMGDETEIILKRVG
jgi:hypothetical protein